MLSWVWWFQSVLDRPAVRLTSERCQPLGSWGSRDYFNMVSCYGQAERGRYSRSEKNRMLFFAEASSRQDYFVAFSVRKTLRSPCRIKCLEQRNFVYHSVLGERRVSIERVAAQAKCSCKSRFKVASSTSVLWHISQVARHVDGMVESAGKFLIRRNFHSLP